MQYILSKRFEKDFAKLPRSIKTKVIIVLSEFANDPANPTLHGHQLKGRWIGHSSIDVASDTRAIFHIVEKDLVRFVAIGSHSQLYR